MTFPAEFNDTVISLGNIHEGDWAGLSLSKTFRCLGEILNHRWKSRYFKVVRFCYESTA